MSAGSERKLGLPPYRVLIVDDHPLVRAGLAARIGELSDFTVVGQCGAVDEAYALALRLTPDLIIVDVALKESNGLDLVKRIRAAELAAKIVVLSAYDEQVYAERALKAGAQGYINKQELSGSLVDAMRIAMSGQTYLSPTLSMALATQALRGGSHRVGTASLSDRELQILSLMGSGMGTRAIAESLHISMHTVESHRENIRTKLNLRTGAELVRYAIQWVLESQR